MEIIRLVQDSQLNVKRTLEELDVPRSSFYRWYRLYREQGYGGLANRPPNARRFWNKIPDCENHRVIDDVKHTLSLAINKTRIRGAELRHRPRLISDNGHNRRINMGLEPLNDELIRSAILRESVC